MLKKENVTLEFDGDKLTFNITRSMRYPKDELECYQVNTIEAVIQNATNKVVEGRDDNVLEAFVLVDDQDVQEEAEKALRMECRDPNIPFSAKKTYVEKLEMPTNASS